jgi:hypothetical protein
LDDSRRLWGRDVRGLRIAVGVCTEGRDSGGGIDRLARSECVSVVPGSACRLFRLTLLAAVDDESVRDEDVRDPLVFNGDGAEEPPSTDTRLGRLGPEELLFSMAHAWLMTAVWVGQG